MKNWVTVRGAKGEPIEETNSGAYGFVTASNSAISSSNW